MVGLCRPAAAQSLADVARQEESRRKGVKAPAKVITNKDLGALLAGAPPPAPPATPVSAAAAPQPPSDKPAAEPAKPADSKEPAKDQGYWSGRIQNLRVQLDRDQTYRDALQSRINALSSDFSARDDPAQRAAIERDRQKALTEHSRLGETIATGQKAIADLEEEARRAGVPPGWLR